MTQILQDFLTGAKNKEFATNTGTQIHARLRQVVVDEKKGNSGDLELIQNIINRTDLKKFFAVSAKTEVSIAGYLNGRFVSRRIDRLLINKDTKTIDFIDYKTDTDKTRFIEQYKRQLNEYGNLLKSAYSGYEINGYILWLADWSLDKQFQTKNLKN
ncbi:MAG: hypothetical protein IKP35_01830 [Alphaproteobacteria bacterium]|nr:hypothetical protein [Alphaproteobacteria bacterium]MBR6010142.1 hypothetical protein [Alphaproteobacteria bacterium]